MPKLQSVDDMGSPRYERARRFANMVQGMMRDFTPEDRVVRQRIGDYLLKVAYEHNLQIINVPPEYDELTKTQLEIAMLENHPAFVSATRGLGVD